MRLIRIFCVGGTIDKIYFDAKSSYEVGPPSITRLLASLSLNLKYEVVSLMQKDSLEMTDMDRESVRTAVAESEETQIVITHGTDTMVETAKVLQSVPNKTIVLTGAFSPALFKNSDAMFNIGAALTAVQTKTAGVYIAMNGQVFNADSTRKDVENNRFLSL